MQIAEAEHIIRGGIKRYEELEESKKMLREELHKVGPHNHAQRARIYYELVRSTLAEEHSSENGTLSQEFTAFQRELSLEEQTYQDKLANKERDRDTRSHIRSAFLSFCHTSERSMTSLEILFRRHSFHEREQAAFLDKMRYRLLSLRLHRKFFALAIHRLMEVTSRFGTSFHRWAATTLATIVLFGSVMMATDFVQTDNAMVNYGQWYDYFYFSVIAFTTAGFGDVLPTTGLLKLIVSVEVLSGYVMLGVLISLIEKKMR